MKRNNVKQITIRLTADEYAHVKQLSKDSGLKMEPAIRRLIMGVNLRPRPPDELPELLRQLSGIGTNINQIAKVANASGYVRKEDIQSIMEMQAALWRAVKRGYPKILATCRSYNIGLNIIVQNIQQIKALYEKEWESIIGNCDTLLFLGGGNEPTSLEFIVKLLGKETIATRTRGQTKGRSGSSSTNFQQTGRDLMTIDEVRKLDTHKAILFIRGEDPVLDKKYNIKRHPNIKLTTDGKAKPYIHKPQGAPDYALPDLPYAFKSLDDYDFIDVEEPEHELSEKEKDFKPDKTE